MGSPTFHPVVRRWFHRRFATPTEPQIRGWASIQSGEHTLIAAPTGSGKTLAAFLSAIDGLVRTGIDDGLEDRTSVLYVSPLKALGNDIERNLQQPLCGIHEELVAAGLPSVRIRTAVRTGDTPAAARAALSKRPPHILVTTPESLYLMLTSDGGRRVLGSVSTVIVDEIHAVVGDKRGAHLALSLERLAALTGQPFLRIGLSATQRPIEEVARFLVGTNGADGVGSPRCRIIDVGHRRSLDVCLELTGSPLEPVMSGEAWDEVYDRLAQLVQAHRTTVVFVNTRRLTERLARHLAERVGKEFVAAHHGALARQQRLAAEQRLKSGDLRVIVATASLELGIDIGAVDLVCQIGSPRSIRGFLQRVGRAGHAVGAISKGRLFPTSRDELVECAALLDAVRRGELDRLCIPQAPIDILAQQIVAACACEEWQEDQLYELIRRAHSYRELTRERFDSVVAMLANGFGTGRGRRSALLFRDAVGRRLRARKGARLLALTSGGAIPDTADYDVVLEPAGTRIGTLNEDFAIESMAGDIFQLGNSSWRILRVEPGIVRVEDAGGLPPTVPFWLGEAPGRTTELSQAVARLRALVENHLLDGTAASDFLGQDLGLGQSAAEQIVEYLGAAWAALGALPTQETIVLERFFDESGGMQLVLHAPLGTRINRAWGLALRKRFCQRFDFELQAAATDDAIVLSLGPTHSFPLADVAGYLHSATVKDLLVQALLVAPMFTARWRWNTGRSLAVPRFRNGKKVAPRLQRMIADDLLSLVFPDQVACLENLAGPREIPDHPLVDQTIEDCLTEAMDLDGLIALLGRIENGEIRILARDLAEPSPLAQEILNARPYAFLDDAPLEERRTQAVMSRRWLDPQRAADIGALDEEAIARVKIEAWPALDDVDELHDALLLLGPVSERYVYDRDQTTAETWARLFAQLVATGRATTITVADSVYWFATERIPWARALFPTAAPNPSVRVPTELDRQPEMETVVVEVIRGWLECMGPTTPEDLTAITGIGLEPVTAALAALERDGMAMRGRFSHGAQSDEFCDRGLLARIHRYTIRRLREEIQPVSSADFMRFLFRWQCVDREHRVQGVRGLERVLLQLEGFEVPAAGWESEVLQNRVEGYDRAWLDACCLSGRFLWARLPTPGRPVGGGPIKTTSIALLPRDRFPIWHRAHRTTDERPCSTEADAVLQFLDSRGASFFSEILHGTRLLRTRLEEALKELVTRGEITADAFSGLRGLVGSGRVTGRLGAANPGLEQAGRWSRTQPLATSGADDDGIEAVARVLLRRYGVVFRAVLARERHAPQWRDLLRVYRTLEARGEIRGGRFVDGYAGEQYALSEAIEMLRSVRRTAPDGQWVVLAGVDPLNLVGIVGGGPKLTAIAGNRVAYRDGIAMVVRDGGETTWLGAIDPADEWEAKERLSRRLGATIPSPAGLAQ